MESSDELSPEDNDTSVPRMWQLWRPFAGIHRWYFSPGCPPPLRNLKGWTGCVQTSILCAAMGLVAAFVGLTVLVATNLLRNAAVWQTVLLGVVFGFIVIYPLSRWIGRSVSWSLAGVILCIVGYASLPFAGPYCVKVLAPWAAGRQTVIERIVVDVLMFGSPNLVLGVFMIGRERKTWWVPLATFITVVTFVVNLQILGGMASSLPATVRGNFVMMVIFSSQPIMTLWTLLAISLGIRLWPSMREPDQLTHPAKSP